MTEPASPSYRTRRIGPADPTCGFRCGKHPLNNYFRRHALSSDQANIGLTYVLDASADDVADELPMVIGFYTLSMAAVSTDVGSVIAKKYDFVIVDATSWPRRMFLPIDVARAAFRDE